MSFTQVDTDLWDGDHFRALPEDARLIFIWSWTNVRAGIAALYPVSMRQIARALTEPRDREQLRELEGRVEAALDVLGAAPPTGKAMVKYDWDSEVIWVVGRAGKANRSPLTRRGIRNQYERCPGSPLKREFAEMYASILRDADPETNA